MAKYREDPMSAADLRKYLESQDDFGLELAIYAKARALGLPATHGGTYEDSVTSKSRQYDVRAFAIQNECRIDLAIECKSLKSAYPLVLSQIPRIDEESYHQVIWSYTRSADFPFREIGPPSKTLTLRQTDGMYPIGAMVGKSTSQVGMTEKGDFTAGDSEVYEKWTQALGSAASLVQDAAYYEEASEGTFSTVVLPFLVVADGTLWTADYSSDGLLMGDPVQCTHTTLFVGRDYWRAGGISYQISHLHVCTRKGMEEFLDRVALDQGLWDLLFPAVEIFEAAAAG
ncbi:hypothetical protein [Variovorax sp. AFSI2.2]|uniref:hypothetical protein n=1 Tax=Variovorax sp. AFSI2.2 TaxID=3384160 RepID=UPI003EBDE0D7